MFRSVALFLLNIPLSNQQTADGRPWAGIARVIRRACVLRERGDEAAAARCKENEVADAVRDFRLRHGPEALPESELREIFTAEERRVAEAMILSELLAPRLVELLPAKMGAAQVGPTVTPARRRPAAEEVSAAPAGPPAISDLLDAMLAAERTGRPSAATKPEY